MPMRIGGERRIRGATIVAVWAGLAAGVAGVVANAAEGTAWPGGSDFRQRRTVEIAQDSSFPTVVVAEFFAQGDLDSRGANLAVHGGKGPVPWRILQVGPGDFCRLAFQTTRGQSRYFIYYGGTGNDKPQNEPAAKPTVSPPWTASAGLLLETRRWRECNLDELDPLRAAFDASETIGSDFVPTVSHGYDPFSPQEAPFLSHYQGSLQVPQAGDFLFFTSSQDASFLLIDGQTVVAAPGRHGPAGQARIKGQIKLTAGPHQFDYWHAASGPAASMLAAWQPPGATSPTTIPPEAFGAGSIARAPAVLLEKRSGARLPDFQVAVLGDVPLIDNEVPLVRVQFRDVASRSVTLNAKVSWHFGDGQTSSEPNPAHIYLHPGVYKVTMQVHHGSSGLEATNRVPVGRALIFPGQDQKLDQLSDYLPYLAHYDPRALDGLGLVQYVQALEQAEDLKKAAESALAAFRDGAPAYGDEVVWGLANRAGPLLRDRLENPRQALLLWRAAGGRISRPEWKAECELQAADICLSDLLHRAEAGPLLHAAEGRLQDAGEAVSRLHRLWGDWHARGGDRPQALAEYAKAQSLRGLPRTAVEQNAWRGAYSRSTEALIREGRLAEALEQLRQWQDDFPADKPEGYLPLLYARWWQARGKHEQAVAAVNDLLAVNPASAYADQLLALSAECEEKLGHAERARAAWNSLLTDYLGSPLVETAKEQLSRLEQDVSRQRQGRR